MFRLLLVLLNVLCMVSTKLVLEDRYYWRDYKHSIPGDALPGGLDSAGRPIYIGQALFESKLIPGKIYSNNSDVHFHWGPVEQRADKNVKILCTLFPSQFEWISTSLTEIPKLTNKLLVDGGYEPTFFTYIGRVHAGDETTVGKVICKLTSCLALYSSQYGEGTFHETGPFEVLAYNPNKN